MVVHSAVSEGKTEMFCEAATRRDGHFGFGVPSRNSGEKKPRWFCPDKSQRKFKAFQNLHLNFSFSSFY